MRKEGEEKNVGTNINFMTISNPYDRRKEKKEKVRQLCGLVGGGGYKRIVPR